MSDNNAAFVGAIPENYDRYLGPVLFEPYAADLVTRLDLPKNAAVLELACGTARNLPFYGDDADVTGIELSPQMLAIGRQRAQQLGHPADLCLGDVQALDFPDESFDTVTCTLGFCTIPDTRAAAAEAFRVLLPGGQLLLLEHVRSPAPIVRVGQRLLEPLAVRFEADHLTRQPLDYLPGVGFEIDEVQRSKWGIVERLRAHKPG